MKKRLIFIFTLLTICSFGQSIDVSSEAGTVEFNFVKEETKGTLTGVAAKISFNPNDLTESKVSGSVNVNTINTGNKTRDHHLMAPDMFNEEEHPEMMFEATSIVNTNGVNQAIGSLTIKGTTLEEVFNITVEDDTMIFTTTVDAAAYGVVSEKKSPAEVEVKVSIPLTSD